MALSFNSSNSLYDFEIREGNGVKGVADLGLSELPERASETLGFFQVVNHGVPLELLESLKDAAHTFFNLPQEKKAVFRTAIRPGLVTKLRSSFVPEK
ncbi:Feruloyl CoA ortho-hydroxylase 1 [Glycine soja]|uniref:Feruloyl CoA ortho-hydroxylase 1 n=1 Tax=Glycine soja TaxID=3848 RepID=A0A445JFS6_GLYSO|nr:Feruloyl CoA ortho-hydroxylase 1 [Glycine soja]